MSVKVLPYQLKKQINEIKNDFFYPSIKKLKGNILEIGFGKGENFQYYSNGCKIFTIEKNEKFLINAEKIFRESKIRLKKGIAEKLPFENEYFDAVVFSFVLCSVNSIEKSLNEILRVLKKNGKVILLEHVKSENKFTIAVQKLITGIQSLFIDCRLDRDPRWFIDKTKFKIISEKIFINHLEPYLFMKLMKL
jgi:ubiquinone/menaquinone biosynthesis C-methylase UbiE